MNNYKIKYTRKAGMEVDNDAVYKLIDDYFGCLYNNGQVVGGYDIFEKDDIFYATFVMPEETALEKKNNSEYANDRVEKLTAVLDYEIINEGENFEYSNPCACENSTWYLLATDHFQNSSPVHCGDCDCPVPLYKISHLDGEKEHFSIICGWQNSHKNMHQLWIDGHWDRFTYGQLSKFNSKLNKEGQRACKELEKVLGKPVYNHIFIYQEDEHLLTPKGMLREIPTTCPKCGNEWTYCGIWDRNCEMLRWLGKEKTNEFKSQFAFCKCDDCRLAMDNPNWLRTRNND